METDGTTDERNPSEGLPINNRNQFYTRVHTVTLTWTLDHTHKHTHIHRNSE